MEFENLLTLIKTVSDSELTDFDYEENGTRIRSEEEKRNRCGFWHFFKCTGYGTPNSAAVGTDHGIRSKDGERYCRW